MTEDVFANNRLSLTLLSSNPTSATVGLFTEECSRGVTALYDNLSDPDYASSYDSNKSAFMYSIKDEITDGSLFDWYALHVRR